jgi:NAD(P)-dependent dehydrogenase (short-subunit alcohol dehydrogenase family)
LLLDKIIAGKPSRIITTSSVAHRSAKIDFADLQFKDKPYRGITAYSQSKLANILFTKELARRLEGSDNGVTANSFHPGAVRTTLVAGDSNPWYYKMVWKLGSPFFLSPGKGADTAIYLASEPGAANVSGKYFVKRKQVKNSPSADDMQAAKRLWVISEKLTGLMGKNDSK